MAEHVRTAALIGIEGLVVGVEVDVCRGLPGIHLVGLPNAEVRESRERVMAALRNSGCRPPAGKITINLAPAGIRKEGASFDLAIAMAILRAAFGRATTRVAHDPVRTLFVGELSLFGDLRPVRGLLAMTDAAVRSGVRKVVVPREQAWEAALVPGVEVVGVATLRQAVSWWMHGTTPGGNPVRSPDEERPGTSAIAIRQADLDRLLASLEGMPLLRKAFIVCAAGGHHMLMTGPPGTGKTRLARHLGLLQPGLTAEEAMEVTRIHSAAGILTDRGLVRQRPFRAPHHTVTRAGLVGGGGGLRPGETTLAHNGLLFLDELTEFSAGVLDVLREPLEEGRVRIARGSGFRTYPARFQLVAAANPCRCGFAGSGIKACRCTAADLRRYRSRLAGPLLDRFDLFVEVAAWEGDFLRKPSPAPGAVGRGFWRHGPTVEMIEKVRRLNRTRGPRSARDLTAEAATYMERMRVRLGLSLRAVERSIGVAGTMADLDGLEAIQPAHLAEALEFRQQSLTDVSIM